MNIGLKEQWDQQTADQLLMEATEGDRHLRAFALELREAMQELVNAHQEMLTEMAVTDDQMRAIIKGASRVSQGKPAAQGRFSKGLEKLKAGGGKVGKAAGKVMGVVDKFVDKIDKSKPVDNFEQKFSKIRAEYLSKNPKMKGYLDKFAELSDKHPKTQAFTIGALSAIASVAGTPLAGAAVGSMLRAGVAAAKGERVVKGAVKGIALGALSGVIGDAANTLGQAFSEAFSEAGKFAIDIANPVRDQIGESGIVHLRTTLTTDAGAFHFNGLMTDDMYAQIKEVSDQSEQVKSFTDEWYSLKAKHIAMLDSVTNNPEVQKELAAQLDQYAIDAQDNISKRVAEKVANAAAHETFSQVDKIVSAVVPGGSAVAAGGAAGSVASNKFARRESIETNKSLIVEANKNAGLSEEDILKIWNTEGSPKDIVEIYKIMKTKIGLSDKEITDILAGAGLDVEEIGLVDDVQAAPPPGEAPQQQTKPEDPKQREQRAENQPAPNKTPQQKRQETQGKAPQAPGETPVPDIVKQVANLIAKTGNQQIMRHVNLKLTNARRRAGGAQ